MSKHHVESGQPRADSALWPGESEVRVWTPLASLKCGPWEGWGEARQGWSELLMPSGTLIWAFLNGSVGSRYFASYFRHLESVSYFVYALIMPYFLYRGLLLLLNYSQQLHWQREKIQGGLWVVLFAFRTQCKKLKLPLSVTTHINNSQIGIDFYAVWHLKCSMLIKI